ncbi:hypothetical protein D3C81_760710 [compost metagenome]
MNTTPARGNGIDIELYHLTVRVQLGQQLEGFGISGLVAKLRGNHRAVDNEVVDVAGGKVRVVLAELAVARLQRWRHDMHLELAPIGVCRVAEYFQMRLGDLVIVGIGIGIEIGDDHPRFNKARIEIDMRIGDVLALDTRQPDDLAQSQTRLQLFFNFSLAPVGVAVGIDPATFGHDRGAVTIHFNAAALAYQFAAQVSRFSIVSQQSRDTGIVFMLLLVAPAIEVEIDRAQVALLGDHEVGTDVAHPDVIQFGGDKGGVLAAAQFFRQIAFAGTAQHSDRLVAGDGAGDQADGFLHVGGEVFPDGLLRAKRDEGALLLVALVRHEPLLAAGRQRPGDTQTKPHGSDQTQACSR